MRQVLEIWSSLNITRCCTTAVLLTAALAFGPHRAISQGGPLPGAGNLEWRVDALEAGLEREMNERRDADQLEEGLRTAADDAERAQRISTDDGLTSDVAILTDVLCQSIQKMAGNPSPEAIALCGDRLFKLVFVTSTVHDGDLMTAGGGATGLEGGDNICNTRAQEARLQGTYTAWLSSNTTSAASRVTNADVPYVRTDGVKVANDYADLVNHTNPESLQAPITKTETGADPLGAPERVWTGTDALGRIRGVGWATCSNWSDTTVNGTGGHHTLTDIGWTDSVFNPCFESYRLYCFQD